MAALGPDTVLDFADAAHLLRRVGFGPTRAEIDALVGMTRAQAVDTVMDLSGAPPAPRPGVVHHENQWWAHTYTIDWWVERMVTSPTPLQEKMTLFWHDHFACGQDKVFDMPAMWDQNRIFRSRCLGNFHDLCQAAAVSSAMLVYIDNESNVAGAEQENFARELMELHTIGVGNFSESDVVAMARAWTGHNTIGWTGTRWDTTYRFYPERHDNGNKTLFGKTRNWDGPDTITEICHGAKQQTMARFIARKLWVWFANASPSTTLVNQLANTFVAADLDIAALVRAVLLRDEFWGPASRWALVKNPAEYMADFLKRTGLPVADAAVRWHMAPMGMTLFDPPNVAGWGENGYWVSTSTAWGKAGFVVNRRWHLSNDRGFFAGLADLAPDAAVDEMLETFGIYQPSAATRSRLRQWFVETRDEDRWAVPTNAIVVTALCPDFQVV